MPKKSKKIQVGFTEEAYESIRREAQARGLSMSAFVAQCAMQTMRREMKKEKVVTDG